MPDSQPSTLNRPGPTDEFISQNATVSASPHSKSLIEKNRIALSWFSCLSLVALTLVTQSEWAAGGLMSGTLLLIGLSLAVIGCIGRIWCALYIDGFKTKQLVTCGPYSLCRNPLYFFSAIGAIGVAFGTSTLIFPSLVAIGFAIYYPTIIRAEERRLVEIHGAAFETYRRHVPAFFPRLTAPASPKTYQIHPKIVGSSMIEASWFVWFTMLTHLLFQLHQQTDFLPTLFTSM